MKVSQFLVWRMGTTFILNLSCSLRVGHECNGIDPVLKYEKLGSKRWLMNTG